MCVSDSSSINAMLYELESRPFTDFASHGASSSSLCSSPLRVARLELTSRLYLPRACIVCVCCPSVCLIGLSSFSPWTQSKRNTNSVAYDPITLKYNDSEDGKRLLYSDQHVRYRAALRANFLNDKMCTNDYNIITGDVTTRTVLPSKPSMT